MKLYPQDEYLLDEMKQLAGSVPPSEEELRLLKIIKLQAVVMPLTCLTTMGERPFWHPEVAAELDILRQTLTQPDYQELYIELEQLYRRNLPSYKYRLNIWDLTAKYAQMPYKVGDYEQAMVALKEETL